MNLFTKQKQTHRLRRQTNGYKRGNVVAGIYERGEPQSFQNVYSVGWMSGADDGK